MSRQSPNVDNHLIIRLIVDGDRRGGEMLYEAYGPGLTFIARRYCPQHAEDCMHDTMLAALEQIRGGKFKAADALPKYLLTIVKRTAWARNARKVNQELNGETFDNAAAITADHKNRHDENFEIQEQAATVLETLKTLTIKEQTILTMFYLHERSPSEICEVLSISLDSFSVLKFRAKQKLQRTMEQNLKDKARSKTLIAR